MQRFDVDTLSDADRAFVEAIAGLYGKIEALKIVFPTGAKLAALTAAQLVLASLVKRAVRSPE